MQHPRYHRAQASGESAATCDERYRALFEYAPDGILIADRQSRYIDANPSMCRMLGYSREELIGLNASDIVAPAEVQHIGPGIGAIIKTADYQREWQFRRKDGSVFPAEVIATAMPDGNLLAMIRDVTERNQADAALRRTEERMRFALQSAHVGIWDMDYVTGRRCNGPTSWRPSTAWRPARLTAPSRRSSSAFTPRIARLCWKSSETR